MGGMKGRAAVLGIAVLMVVVAACGPTATDGDAEVGDGDSRIEPSHSVVPELGLPLNHGDDGGIEALQIDGVWVFEHRPESSMNALHGGTPEVVDGCLYIDNTIVVWHVDRIDQAAGAIAGVKAGKSSQLLIGGGGMSIEEGTRPDQFPTVITERCPTSAVWFNAP